MENAYYYDFAMRMKKEKLIEEKIQRIRRAIDQKEWATIVDYDRPTMRIDRSKRRRSFTKFLKSLIP